MSPERGTGDQKNGLTEKGILSLTVFGGEKINDDAEWGEASTTTLYQPGEHGDKIVDDLRKSVMTLIVQDYLGRLLRGGSG